ncbi:MAG: hypothetical protein M1834_004497 [Cirrosporium novae-zelandiae]|nr:MAG: hypothetical protein M1834_004497 [Cirrosporium novae-zelandiae]
MAYSPATNIDTIEEHVTWEESPLSSGISRSKQSLEAHNNSGEDSLTMSAVISSLNSTSLTDSPMNFTNHGTALNDKSSDKSNNESDNESDTESDNEPFNPNNVPTERKFDPDIIKKLGEHIRSKQRLSLSQKLAEGFTSGSENVLEKIVELKRRLSSKLASPEKGEKMHEARRHRALQRAAAARPSTTRSFSSNDILTKAESPSYLPKAVTKDVGRLSMHSLLFTPTEIQSLIAINEDSTVKLAPTVSSPPPPSPPTTKPTPNLGTTTKDAIPSFSANSMPQDSQSNGDEGMVGEGKEQMGEKNGKRLGRWNSMRLKKTLEKGKETFEKGKKKGASGKLLGKQSGKK